MENIHYIYKFGLDGNHSGPWEMMNNFTNDSSMDEEMRKMSHLTHSKGKARAITTQTHRLLCNRFCCLLHLHSPVTLEPSLGF